MGGVGRCIVFGAGTWLAGSTCLSGNLLLFLEKDRNRSIGGITPIEEQALVVWSLLLKTMDYTASFGPVAQCKRATPKVAAVLNVVMFKLLLYVSLFSISPSVPARYF